MKPVSWLFMICSEKIIRRREFNGQEIICREGLDSGIYFFEIHSTEQRTLHGKIVVD